MKRPLLVISFIYSVCMGFSIYLGVKASICLCTLFFAVLIVIIFVKPLRRQSVYPISCLVAAIAFGTYSIINIFGIMPITSSLDGVTTEATFRIVDIVHHKDEFTSYEAETMSIGHESDVQKVKVILNTFSSIDCDYGDKVSCTATFEAYESNGFSIDSYYASEGTFLSATIDRNGEINVEDSVEEGLFEKASGIKRRMCNNISSILPKRHASLVRAVLLGDKSILADSVASKFRNLTTYHLIVVSGLHTGIIGMFLYKVFGKVIRKRIPLACIASLGILCYMLLVGMSPSVVRSGIMLIIYYWGEALFEKSDSLNSIGISALVLVGANPLVVGNMGFQLTFVTTSAVILWSSKLGDIIKSRLNFTGKPKAIAHWIVDSFSMTACATFAMLPFTILIYKDFSPYFLINNLILTPVIQMIVVIGFVTVLLSLLGILSFMVNPVTLVVGVACNFVLNMLSNLSSLPYSNTYIGTKPIVLWLGAIFVLIGVSFIILNDRLRKRRLIAGCTVLLALSLTVGFVNLHEDVSIEVLDVNGGTAVMIRDAGKVALVCGQASYEMLDETMEKIHDSALTVSAVIINDKKNFSEKVIADYTPSTLYIGTDNIRSQTLVYEDMDLENIVKVKDTLEFSLWGSVDVKIVNIEGKIWVYVDIGETTALIAPIGGDCGSLPDDIRWCDYLIVSGKIKNVQNVNSVTTVVSLDRGKMEKVFGNLSQSTSRRIVTTLNGEITLPLDILKQT